MLEVQSLNKYYKGKAVLNGISFQVEKGEVLGIVGPNGAGKSTLLRIISGIIDPDGGNVKIDEKPHRISDSGYWGYLPEERGLYPLMNLLDQLVHFAALKGYSSKKAKEKATQLLHDWKMDHYMQVKAGDLSKGNQQRIQFLSCILHDPSLIILDEPFSGLDPIQTDWLKDQIRLFRAQGKLILYSSHRMDSVEALCDRILVLHEGSITGYGSAAELCAQGEEVWEVAVKGGDGSWQDVVQVIDQQQKDGQQVVRFLLHTSSVSSVLAEIEKSGASLEFLRRHKRSLHEVFVQLTSRSHVA